MIVMKFGGSSVGTGERIAGVARIAARVLNDTGSAPVVVVSAMSGVTDALIRAARTAASGDRTTFRTIRDELQKRHEQAIVECGIDAEHARGLRAEAEGLLTWFENLCQSIATLGELTPRGLDVVASLGERFTARIVAATLLSQGTHTPYLGRELQGRVRATIVEGRLVHERDPAVATEARAADRVPEVPLGAIGQRLL